MPPWLPEPGLGLADERRLSEAEITALEEWAAAGAPEGNAARSPAVPEFPVGWQLGTPDVELTTKAFELAPEGEDVFRNFVLPTSLDGLRYVRGVELRCDNPPILHHAAVMLDTTGESRRREAEEPGPGFSGMDLGGAHSPDGQFLGWTPGKVPSFLPGGMAWRLPPGADLVVQTHLLPTGKPEAIKLTVALYFTETPPAQFPVMLRLGPRDFEIPAGDESFPIVDRYELPVDVTVLAVYPHAHYLGKTMSATATTPEGRARRLLEIGDWDFNWQDDYQYDPPIALARGTAIEMNYTFDNSATNPRNPTQPPVAVPYGPYSADEMGDLWLQLLPNDPADLNQLLRHSSEHQARIHVDSLRFAAEREPDKASRHYDLALGLNDTGQSDAAIVALEKALELDPEFVSAHTNLGVVHAQRGEFDRSRESFRRALALDPQHVNANNGLGATLLRLDLPGEAIAPLQRAVAGNPNHLHARMNLATAFTRTETWNEAVREWTRVLRQSPQQRDAYPQLARACEGAGRLADACRWYRRTLQSTPDLDAAIRLAWILATSEEESVRDGQEALRWARNAAQRVPAARKARALDTLAAAQAELKRFPAAVQTATKALDLAKKSGDGTLVASLQARIEGYRGRRPHRGSR